MRLLSLAIVSAALSIAAPAASKTNAQTADQAASGQSEKVCKKLKTTGSRMAERVCLTRDQWKQVDQVK